MMRPNHQPLNSQVCNLYICEKFREIKIQQINNFKKNLAKSKYYRFLLKKFFFCITVPPEEPVGLVTKEGDVNWNCPCIGSMAIGPCGVEFREAFGCFHYR